MPQARKRKGHNKRIQKRRDQMKAFQNSYQKLLNEAMKAQLEELKNSNNSGDTLSDLTQEPS